MDRQLIKQSVTGSENMDNIIHITNTGDPQSCVFSPLLYEYTLHKWLPEFTAHHHLLQIIQTT